MGIENLLDRLKAVAPVLGVNSDGIVDYDQAATPAQIAAAEAIIWDWRYLRLQFTPLDGTVVTPNNGVNSIRVRVDLVSIESGTPAPVARAATVNLYSADDEGNIERGSVPLNASGTVTIRLGAAVQGTFSLRAESYGGELAPLPITTGTGGGVVAAAFVFGRKRLIAANARALNGTPIGLLTTAQINTLLAWLLLEAGGVGDNAVVNIP